MSLKKPYSSLAPQALMAPNYLSCFKLFYRWNLANDILQNLLVGGL